MTKEKINTNWSVNFSSRESNSGETIVDIQMNWENPKDEAALMRHLNTWLNAIGEWNLEVVPKKSK